MHETVPGKIPLTIERLRDHTRSVVALFVEPRPPDAPVEDPEPEALEVEVTV